MAFDLKDRAFGYVPDDPMERVPQIVDRFGVSWVGRVDPPEEFSNEHLLYERPASRPDLPEQLLQFSTSTCVSYGLAALTWAEQRRLGVPPEECVLPSTKAGYYAGLRREHGLNADLIDIGSRPRDVWAAAREIGIAEWEQCPLLEHEQDKLLRQCHDGAWIAASDPGFLTDYRFDTVGLSERPLAIKRSIFMGHAVGLGLTLYRSFDDVYDNVWTGRQGPTDERTGRHYIIGYAYDPEALHVQHWWRGWGKAGCKGKISWDVVASLETSDLITAVLDLEKW